MSRDYVTTGQRGNTIFAASHPSGPSTIIGVVREEVKRYR